MFKALLVSFQPSFVLINSIIFFHFLYIIFGKITNKSSVFSKEIKKVIDCFDKEFPAIETLGGDTNISPTKSAADSRSEHQEVATPKENLFFMHLYFQVIL